MNLAIPLSADDIDAMATGLGLVLGHLPLKDLALVIADAAETQPGSPQAQLVLRLIAEALRAEADEEPAQ